MVITKTRIHNDITIMVNGHLVSSKQCVKYLGVLIDSKSRFKEHARSVAAKAGKVVQRLSRIMPNISAARPTKRNLLSNVSHSIQLYVCTGCMGCMGGAYECGWMGSPQQGAETYMP